MPEPGYERNAAHSKKMKRGEGRKTKVTEFFRETIAGFSMPLGDNSAKGLQKRLVDTEGMLLLCFDRLKHFVSKCRIEASVLLPCINRR